MLAVLSSLSASNLFLILIESSVRQGPTFCSICTVPGTMILPGALIIQTATPESSQLLHPPSTVYWSGSWPVLPYIFAQVLTCLGLTAFKLLLLHFQN